VHDSLLQRGAQRENQGGKKLYAATKINPLLRFDPTKNRNFYKNGKLTDKEWLDRSRKRNDN
jgi:hypothetical protein